MSSTNRSNARDTHISDYYVTPVASILEFLKHQTQVVFTNKVILDPCAGGDSKHKMSYPEALKSFSKSIATIDIRNDSLAELQEDYLVYDLSHKPDIIITNPPFNLAIEIIEKALQDVKEGGYVIMLLRLNFFGSKKRKPFFDAYPPLACYVHSNRMKFTNTSGTDSIEYMHCIWKKGHKPDFTQLKVI